MPTETMPRGRVNISEETTGPDVPPRFPTLHTNHIAGGDHHYIRQDASGTVFIPQPGMVPMNIPRTNVRQRNGASPSTNFNDINAPALFNDCSPDRFVDN